MSAKKKWKYSRNQIAGCFFVISSFMLPFAMDCAEKRSCDTGDLMGFVLIQLIMLIPSFMFADIIIDAKGDYE